MKKHHRVAGWATPRGFWAEHRESTLNWLALGLLLAAWNAADSESASNLAPQPKLAKGHKSVNEL
jgi:hypothetical protein